MTKRIVIPATELPSLIAGETDVFVRFRIVSSDRNRISAWSPIFNATPTVPFVNAIADLQDSVATLQSDMTTAQGDITTLEGNVSTIQGDVVTIEGDIVSLFNISDDNFAISVVL